jgi:hypothetical protein
MDAVLQKRCICGGLIVAMFVSGVAVEVRAHERPMRVPLFSEFAKSVGTRLVEGDAARVQKSLRIVGRLPGQSDQSKCWNGGLLSKQRAIHTHASCNRSPFKRLTASLR